MADDSTLPSPNDGMEGMVRRNLSETVLHDVDQHGHQDHFDPYKSLERSQSDASLVKDNSGVFFTLTEGSQVQGRSSTHHHASVLHHESHFVSESSKVYYDLSKAVAMGDEDQDSLMKIRRDNLALGPATGVKLALETIPQKEELKIKSFHRSISNESDSSGAAGGSTENLGHGTKISTEERSFVTTSSAVKYGHGHTAMSDDHTHKGQNNFNALLQASSVAMKLKAKVLAQKGLPAKDQKEAMADIQDLVEKAWATPKCGRDLAYNLCDMIRTEGALDTIIHNCTIDCSGTDAGENTDLLKTSAKLLDQIMTTGNRDWVVHFGLKEVVKMTVDWKRDVELSRAMTGILESLFKHSEDTSQDVMSHGGLDVILYWCRTADCTTLRHCAISLANLAIFSGRESHQDMIKQRVPEWLFPLAFSRDDSVRYYACLAIATLAANKEIESAVMNSGTMDLVLPFIATHKPSEFAKFDSSHVHGRSRAWLKKLIPVLCSKREEAQTLAAFHFAMEAGIKAEQNKKAVFHEIGAIEPLKRLASSPNATASKLAAEALNIMGESVPYKLKQQVPLWSEDDVTYWVSQVGFGGYADQFRECHVDGDLLLLLTDTDLQDSIDMNKTILRKRFLRELKELKTTADYLSCDPTKLDEWLISVAPDFTYYTYQMLRSGVDKYNLSCLSDENLRCDCGINNGIHRKKILSAIHGLSSVSPSSAGVTCTDGSGVDKCIDVFISYRRSNGSQLASLLKVHLQLRGFSVFLDIEQLRAGKFDEGLLTSVKMAKHFILVLTPNALERCIGDNDRKDWVHKEIAAALESGCNIIPLYDDFQFPSPESLPEDIRSVGYFNGIRWIHDYQDACVDKLESFIRGDVNVGDETALVQRVKHLSSGDSTRVVPCRNSGPVSPVSPCEVFKTCS